MNEDTPVHPTSRKGEIRARVAERLFDAHRRGDVRAVSGRASDFYGPGGTLTYFGKLFWDRVLAGKSAQLVMSPDTPHTWHYTLDVAAALAALGEAGDQDYGRWWMLPAAPAVTTREMVARLAAALGRPVPTQRIPRPMLRVLGLFMPIVGEVLEMDYQWEEPFLVDDRRFRARFGQVPTPLEEGARATVAWAREAFAGR